MLSILGAVSAGVVFLCTPTAVWDGDGPIWCAEGPRVRLAGVAAREIDESCRPGHPCPRVSDEEARNRLVRLLGGSKGNLKTGHIIVQGPKLTCRSVGSANGTRTAAWCSSPALGDLSCAVVGSGAVVIWPRYWGNHRCPWHSKNPN